MLNMYTFTQLVIVLVNKSPDLNATSVISSANKVTKPYDLWLLLDY